MNNKSDYVIVNLESFLSIDINDFELKKCAFHGDSRAGIPLDARLSPFKGKVPVSVCAVASVFLMFRSEWEDSVNKNTDLGSVWLCRNRMPMKSGKNFYVKFCVSDRDGAE